MCSDEKTEKFWRGGGVLSTIRSVIVANGQYSPCISLRGTPAPQLSGLQKTVEAKDTSMLNELQRVSPLTALSNDLVFL